MAKVRILPAIVHTSYGHTPGEVVEIRDDIAATWVNAGLAERVEGEPDTPEREQTPETPEDDAGPETPEDGDTPETATARRAARRRK